MYMHHRICKYKYTIAIIVCYYSIPSSLTVPCIARNTNGAKSTVIFLAVSGEYLLIA